MQTQRPPQRHSRRLRLSLALAIGAACGVVSWLYAAHVVGFNQDFEIWWRAAHAVLHHQNPYAIRATEGPLTGQPLFYYPLPMAIAVIPFAWLPTTVAGPLFLGTSCAVLANALLGGPRWRLAMFLSASMFVSVVAANLLPLLTTAMLVPSLAWLGVLKPNIGLAILAYRWSWKSALAMVVIAGASLLVMPSWPREWISTAARSHFHFAPWRVWGGLLIAPLALTRWHRPEARMLAVMSLVPSSPVIYEALPLFLIPRTRRELVLLAAFSYVVFGATLGHSLLKDPEAFMAIARPAIVYGMYLPALVMVLRQRNVAPSENESVSASSSLPFRVSSPTLE